MAMEIFTVGRGQEGLSGAAYAVRGHAVPPFRAGRAAGG